MVLSINPLPIAGFINEVNMAEVSFTNTSKNAETHFWDFGDGNTETIENPVHIYDASGNYSVWLKALSELCGESSDTQAVSISTGIDIIEFGDVARIYPNPSQGIFYFVVNEKLNDKLVIKVYDSRGKVILSNYEIIKSLQKIDLNDQPAGVYFIQIRFKDYSKTGKLVIE